MIQLVRHGKEHEEEIYEPVEWPPRRRDEPTRREEPTPREEPVEAPPERKREKVPA